jgi:hypothetical protein
MVKQAHFSLQSKDEDTSTDNLGATVGLPHDMGLLCEH